MIIVYHTEHVKYLCNALSKRCNNKRTNAISHTIKKLTCFLIVKKWFMVIT